MDLIISISGHFLTVVSALVAIYEKTWDEKEIGLKKLTKIGRLAAIVAILGLSLSVYQTIDKHKKARAYERHALLKIEKGWSLLFIPFEALYHQVTEKKVKKGEHVSFARQLLQNDILKEFDKLDFNQMHRFKKFGKLGYMLCSQTISGMGLMMRSINEYKEHLNLDIKRATEDLQNMKSFTTLIRFGGCPGEGIHWKNSPDNYKGIFDTTEMRAYISKLIEYEKYLK